MSIVRILTRVCLDLLRLVNSLNTLFKILIFQVWQYCFCNDYKKHTGFILSTLELAASASSLL